MPFSLKGKAQIKNLTITRGGSDDSEVTVKIGVLVADVPVSALAGPFGVEDPKELESSWFKDASVDADRNTRFLGLKAITSTASYKERHSIILARQRRLRVSSVGSITATPRAFGKCDVTCVISVKQPPQGYIENIAEQLHSETPIELEHDQELPLQGGGATAPAPKKTEQVKAPAKKAKPTKRAAKKAPKRKAA